MDFLTLFALYVLCVLSCIFLLCRYSGQTHTPFHTVYNCTAKVFCSVSPQWLQTWTQRSLHRLFHQRSNAFVYLHLLLEGLVFSEFTFEVLTLCRATGTSLTALSAPYALLLVKTFFFYLCISSDPGIVTRRKAGAQVKTYPYDGRLFNPGVQCPTCQLIKPARSKHCRVCDRCVHRFDHHCVWVNNCVGAMNTRYFLLYLLSVCAMAAAVAALTADALLHAVLRSGLLRASYIDAQGQQQPAGVLFIVQHLFLTFPRIVYMLGFVVFVFFLLAGYTSFHCFLALVNQTSNEWYKSRGHACPHCGPASEASDHLCHTAPDHSQRYFYNRGVLANLGQIFFPPKPVKRKEK